jgi:gamma-glutamyltranspeptidase/glutathione hydrolase
VTNARALGAALLVLACTTAGMQEPPAPGAARASTSATIARTSQPSSTPLASTIAAPSAPASASAPSRAPAPLAPGVRAVAGKNGLVVAAEPLATRAGVSVLEAGGNAVDAAVATALALAVTHPSAGNLGGGGFMLVRPPGGPTLAIDFRETAPSSLTRVDFDRMIAAKGTGPAAPGVPGSVAGLLLAEQRFGKLARERVFAPAVALARDGVVLSRDEAALLAAHWASLKLDRSAQKVFGDAHGAPLRAGARLVQPALATTLQNVAARGESAFYAGPAAESLVRATAGHISVADLANYRAVERAPIHASYRGLELETMPPPSAGGLVLAGTLVALERLEPDPPRAEDADSLHLLLELWRRAQALRRFNVLDPDALDEAGRHALVRRFLDPAELTAVPIDPAHATPSERVHPLYADALKELEHTTHLSVIDAAGMVVSLTTTLSASFGAKIMVPATGVLLGNAVGSFSSMGDNLPVAGRRTTSSMAPTLVLENGRARLVLGTPGGDTIPSTLSLLATRLIDFHEPLDEAVDAPRIHHGFVPDQVRFEAARPLPAPLRQALQAKGHHFLRSFLAQGDASVILVGDDGVSAFGYADPREGPGLALAAEPSTGSPSAPP